ncbi:MAG: glucose-6-phosphate dehydrogenase [Patescibacteria group bacterium]
MEPSLLVIFGITGDLANRKLLPALYHLANDQLLPTPFRIIGVTRRGTTVPAIIAAIRSSVEASGETCNPKALALLKRNISIVTMDITSGNEYTRLKLELDHIEAELGICMNRLFYLAIPSQVFGPIVKELGESKLSTGCQHGTMESRLLIEKPFGFDLPSAKQLILELEQVFSESQIYRIDHYLAKETVQNILTFRLQNPLFEAVWNSKQISHILVTAAESIGIEGRVNFYEQIGALRDIIQSHLLQIVALITMEKPTKLTAQAIHQEKLKVLQDLSPPSDDHMSEFTVRGQYQGYRQEVGNSKSQTETYAAIKLTSKSRKWENVPILIRTGKHLAAKATEVMIVFQDPSQPLNQNYLIIRIQPHESIILSVVVKKPGSSTEVEKVQMSFSYGDRADVIHADAYERVLADAMRGDKTLFATSEEVLESWRIVQPILDAWSHDRTPLHEYIPGSYGPAVGNQLAHNAGINWLIS